MTIEITKHAIQRARQRFNISASALYRTAQKAFDIGVHHDLAPTQVRKWAQHKIRNERPDHQIRITGNRAFMFHHHTLITVFIIPANVLPRLKKHKPSEL